MNYLLIVRLNFSADPVTRKIHLTISTIGTIANAAPIHTNHCDPVGTVTEKKLLIPGVTITPINNTPDTTNAKLSALLLNGLRENNDVNVDLTL